jgi:hypothetical protein
MQVAQSIREKYGITGYPTRRDLVDVLSEYDIEHTGPILFDGSMCNGLAEKRAKYIHLYVKGLYPEKTLIHEFLHGRYPAMDEADVRKWDWYVFHVLKPQKHDIMSPMDVVGVALDRDILHTEDDQFLDDGTTLYIPGERGSVISRMCIIQRALWNRHQRLSIDRIEKLAMDMYYELYGHMPCI